MEPSAQPIYFSIFRAIPGAPSNIELSSSPLKAPAAIACDNCTIALDCSTADAPPIAKVLFICSINAINSSLLVKAEPAFKPILAIASAISKYPAPLSKADFIITSDNCCVVLNPSLIIFNRDNTDVTLSDKSPANLMP